jgi:hypothetical protein
MNKIFEMLEPQLRPSRLRSWSHQIAQCAFISSSLAPNDGYVRRTACPELVQSAVFWEQYGGVGEHSSCSAPSPPSTIKGRRQSGKGCVTHYLHYRIPNIAKDRGVITGFIRSTNSIYKMVIALRWLFVHETGNIWVLHMQHLRILAWPLIRYFCAYIWAPAILIHLAM